MVGYVLTLCLKQILSSGVGLPLLIRSRFNWLFSLEIFLKVRYNIFQAVIWSNIFEGRDSSCTLEFGIAASYVSVEKNSSNVNLCALVRPL